MRQWMVNPKFMCNKHLFGEHVEHHMFLGALKNKKNIYGYIKNNLFEPLSLKIRHDEIVEEIERRGYNHSSPLEYEEEIFNYFPQEIKNYKIDRTKSEKELFSRCRECLIRKNTFI